MAISLPTHVETREKISFPRGAVVNLAKKVVGKGPHPALRGMMYLLVFGIVCKELLLQQSSLSMVPSLVICLMTYCFLERQKPREPQDHVPQKSQ